MRSMTPQILLVAGPGRSGTSLFTGLLSRLGFYVPKPEVAAERTNPRGFSEPRWAVDFHDNLLKTAQVAVDDSRPGAWERADKVATRPAVVAELQDWLAAQVAISPRVVVKDPRIGWFLDSYRRVADDLGAELRVVTLLRHPAEVLRSRELAYGTYTSANVRSLGWVNMMIGVEQRTRDLPRAIVRYEDLLADWRPAMAAAERSLGLEIVEGADAGRLADADELVDPNLRRSVTSWEELGLIPRVREITEGVYDTYGGLVGTAQDEQQGVRAQLAEWAAAHEAYYEECWDVVQHRRRFLVRRERRKAVRQDRERRAETGAESASS